MPSRRLTVSACGRVRGWRWRESPGVTRSAPPASISCRSGCRPRHTGICRGATAAGAALTRRRRHSCEVPTGCYIPARHAYLRSFAGVSLKETLMVALTFPDGARRDYPPGTTGLDVAKGISPSLAKRTVAMALDGALADLADPIEKDAKIEFVSREDPRALELIRHDAAHVLAEAVQSLWPGTQVTIGPVIENGFYYDFFRNEPFTPEDFPAIEKKMREIVARDRPFSKQVVSRDAAKDLFEKKGEAFKVELIDAIPPDQEIKLYSQGEWLDLCRGPHMTSTG